MKKTIITIAVALLIGSVAMAEIRRVAVFDPTGNVENHIKGIVRGEITSVIVNAGNFIVLEREQIDQVLRESHFQATGLVDDTQIVEMGRLMGANLVFLTNIAPHNENFHISGRMINVQTGQVERLRTAQTTRGTRDLIEVVERMTQDMFGVMGDALVTQGRNVFQGGRELTQREVQQIMSSANNALALAQYNRGLQRNRNGNVVIYSGLGVIGVGAIVMGAVRLETGGLIMFPGAVIAVTGLVLKSTSNRLVRDAVNMHNQGLLRADSNIELNFGVTQNGVGLVLNF